MKPIEKVYIEASGDPSVGIPRSHFEATCYIERDDAQFVQDMREMFETLYADMIGEDVGVLFDYEMEAREAAMQRAEEQGDMT